MDVDRALANRLAEAFRDDPLRVPIPESAARLREWGGDFFFAFEGQKAAMVQLYPVAFSEDGERALTILDITCGPGECGLGLVVLLRRVGVEWVLESQVLDWQG